MHVELTGSRGPDTCAVIAALVHERLDEIGIASELEVGTVTPLSIGTLGNATHAHRSSKPNRPAVRPSIEAVGS
jgi:hypothetical protein